MAEAKVTKVRAVGPLSIGFLPGLSNRANPVYVEAAPADPEVQVPCEVFSRIVGYYRPVQNWNEGKQQEFQERKTFHALIDEDTRGLSVQQIRDAEQQRAAKREAAEQLILDDGLDLDKVREMYAGDFQELSYPAFVGAVWAYHSQHKQCPKTLLDINVLVMVRVLQAGKDYPPIAGMFSEKRTLGAGDVSAFSLEDAEREVRKGRVEYLKRGRQ